MDYWSVHSVEVVKKGQTIANYCEPVAGEDGIDVLGRVIAAKKGKGLPPLVGRGFDKFCRWTYIYSCYRWQN